MIEIKDCVMEYDDFRAVDGITLSIPSGCSYGLLGSNAAGKSTLLKAMSGVYKPASGSVTMDGVQIFDNPAIKERLFFVDDETVQFSNITLWDMRKMYKRFYPKFSETLFYDLLGTVGLPEKRKLHTFSKGMKRQAAVICGISACTDYLFIDEAFDGIDQTMRTVIKKIMIDAMLDRQLTVVFSSHNLGEIDEFCDRAALIYGGKVVFDRDIESVKDDLVKVQAVFDRTVTKEDFPGLDIVHIENSGSITYIIAHGGFEKLRAAGERLSPTVWDEMRLTLKEIFVYEMEGAGYDGSRLENKEQTA